MTYLFKKYRALIIALSLGVIYYIITQISAFRIPCPIHKLTGLACPGCGITAFVICLLHLDVLGAINENLAAAVILPIICFLYIAEKLFHPAWLKRSKPIYNIILWSCVFLLIAFGIVRNLPGMEWLLPSALR